MSRPEKPRDPNPDEQCIAHRKNGDRCRNWALVGLTVCRSHGGAQNSAKQKSLRAKEKREMSSRMAAFVKPISADDPEAHPLTAFEVEFRRTLGRIRWLDEELAATSRDALFWGQTKREKIGASEFTGKNETFEARANVLLIEQKWERQHLLDMQKIWIGARLDERKLDIQRAYVVALDRAIVGILKGLGHDPADPVVRQVVRDGLLALPAGELS